jgi:hypothetical protein
MNMQMFDDVPDAPEDALLSAAGQLGADDELRGAVLARTVGVLRRRRRLKRCALAAGLLGCYLAGVATMGVWPAGERANPQMAQVTVTAEPKPQKATPALPSPSKPALPSPSKKIEVHQVDVRQVAAAKPTAFESWRRIGDHYFRESGDISLAVAGYTQALDLASEKEQAIAPGQDDWLMMALKDARAKEKRHVHSETN